jgi:presenilin-like A22 family membrane protease
VKKTIAGLLSVFYLTQVATVVIVGLVTVPSPDPTEPRQPRVHYLEGGETIESSLYIYAFLMAGVALIAVAMKLGLGRILFRNLETVIVFVSLFLLLYSVYPGRPLAWLAVGVVVATLKRKYPHWLLVSGLSVLTAATVGGIMGISLGTFPIIALMGCLSVYDVVAVRFSTYMSNVVDNVRGSQSSFLVEMPGMESAVGISDLAVPSMFVASNALANSVVSALWVGLGGAFGLGLAIIFSDRKGMVPALPFVFAGSMAAYLPIIVG